MRVRWRTKGQKAPWNSRVGDQCGPEVKACPFAAAPEEEAVSPQGRN